jgi:hypothetical protein
MKHRKGFLLVAVLFVLLLLIITVPTMVQWMKDDTRIAIKDQKASLAFQLAEAAIDRGYWKAKSSTSTFADISAGNTVARYNFDTTYNDIAGGTYRVRISSGPDLDQITIIGEGRDFLNRETRAIQTVFTNVSVPGAILSGGKLVTDGGSVIHWGPVMAMGDIELEGYAQTNGYPRKLSRGTVTPLDTTIPGTDPPNTDSLEWWSNYNVPELPVFDFTAMRSSAAASHTLNCQDVEVVTMASVGSPCLGKSCTDTDSWRSGCTCTSVKVGAACVDPGSNCTCYNKTYGSECVDTDGAASNCSCAGSGTSKVCTGSSCTDSDGAAAGCIRNTRVCIGSSCQDPGANCDSGKICTGEACTGGTNCSCSTSLVPQSGTAMQCCGADTCDYGGTGCVNCTVNDLYNQTTLREMDYTWYWDNGDAHTGTTYWQGDQGVKGTIVTRGNLDISGDDYYCQQFGSAKCTVAVPPQAWREYQRYDTDDDPEYPGDIGKSTNSATYKFGSNATGEVWMTTSDGLGADLGIYGFLYVGGKFTRRGASDIYGAMWVVGDVESIGGNTMIFYNSRLNVPTLNVVLMKDSWQEIKPSASAWP